MERHLRQKQDGPTGRGRRGDEEHVVKPAKRITAPSGRPVRMIPPTGGSRVRAPAADDAFDRGPKGPYSVPGGRVRK